jgi:hypothetical protein
MKKIYLSMAAALMFTSAFNQKVIRTTNNKAKAETINVSYDAVKKKNNISSRATSINHWIAFDDAYSLYMGSSYELTTMANGPLANDSNVSMQTTSGIDTVFTFGAYSIIDLGGTFYSATVFNPNLQPFDVAADVIVDSVFAGFTYEKFDSTVVDTAVIRLAIPTANQMDRTFSYVDPNGTHPTTGDSIDWIAVRFDGVKKEIRDAVAEYKLPLTDAFLNNPANKINASSSPNWYGLDIDVNDTLVNHQGLIAIEVNVLHGRQLTTADTVGVNANWFSPTYISVDGTTPPAYSADDYTDGGVLYSFEYFDDTTGTFYSHWFGNSANQISETGDIDPFQSAWVSLKIQQNNTMNADITELENGSKLFQNYPNPISDFTTIKYELRNASDVSFEVADVTGKKVISLYEGKKAEGIHNIELNTNNLNAGVYFYSVIVNGNRLTKKMTISK